VVVLSQVLACDATLGYEELYNVQVLRFNGEPVRNLRHLAQLCLDCRAAFMRFDLDYDVRAGPPLRPARRPSSAAALRPPRSVQTRVGAPRSLAGLLGSAANLGMPKSCPEPEP